MLDKSINKRELVHIIAHARDRVARLTVLRQISNRVIAEAALSIAHLEYGSIGDSIVVNHLGSPMPATIILFEPVPWSETPLCVIEVHTPSGKIVTQLSSGNDIRRGNA